MSTDRAALANRSGYLFNGTLHEATRALSGQNTRRVYCLQRLLWSLRFAHALQTLQGFTCASLKAQDPARLVCKDGSLMRAVHLSTYFPKSVKSVCIGTD